MGFFSWLNDVLNPPEPILLEHPYFGKLTYVSGTNVHGEKFEYWDCEKVTPLVPEALSMSVKADRQGPDDAAKVALEELIRKFPELQTRIFDVLLDEWSEVLKNLRDYDGDDEMIQRIRGFHDREKMAEVYELSSVSIAVNEIDKYELTYTYRGELGEYDTTYVVIIVHQNWSVSHGGGGD